MYGVIIIEKALAYGSILRTNKTFKSIDGQLDV
jgi:hypothetical protein